MALKTLLDVSPAPLTYFDASNLASITKDGSNNVSAVADLGSAGNNLVNQNTPPVYDAVGLNSKPTFKEPSGTGLYSYFKADPSSGLPSSTGAHTWVLFGNFRSEDSYLPVIGHSDRNFGDIGNVPSVLKSGSDQSSSIGWDTTLGDVIVWTVASGSNPLSEIWVNGSVGASSNLSSYSTTSGQKLQLFYGSDVPKGVAISLFAIFGSALDTTNRQIAEGIVAWAYGREAALPIGHPYKSAPPSTGGGGITLTADAGSYSLSGTAATLRKGKVLAGAAGSYSVTGTAAGVKRGRKLPAAAGSYALTGTAAGIKRGYKVVAGVGSYSLTGTNATLFKGRTLVAGVGSYSFTGSAAGVQRGRKVGASAGSYSLTGTDATITKAGVKILAAAAGSYSITGTAAGLLHGWKLVAGAGSYSLTGTAATIKRGRNLPASAGSYSITGTAAALKHAYKLVAGAGSYSLTGTAANLVKGGKALIADSGAYTITGTAASPLLARYLVADSATYLISGYDLGITIGVAAGTWVPVDKDNETWSNTGSVTSTWTPATITREEWSS